MLGTGLWQIEIRSSVSSDAIFDLLWRLHANFFNEHGRHARYDWREDPGSDVLDEDEEGEEEDEEGEEEDFEEDERDISIRYGLLVRTSEREGAS